MRDRYKAFLSYGHAADRLLAPAIEQGLKMFAKPWLSLRAMNVFRDAASLSANPGLWPSITSALDASTYFVLFASPAAAKSEWVEREIDHWLATKAPEFLLIILTDGNICWSSAAGDFDWSQTTAIPERLRGVFQNEPRWVDLRWAKGQDDVSLANPRFRSDIADLSATLQGIPKDRLVGRDVQLQRQARRTRSLFVAGLTIVAVLALAAAVVAVSQRNEALRRDSLRMADLSGRLLADGDTGMAVRMALEALPRHDGMRGFLERPYVAQAETALVRAAYVNRERIRLSGNDGALRHAEFDPAGERIATASTDERVRVWDASTGELLHEFNAGAGAPYSAKFSSDGSRIVANFSDNSVVVWDAINGGVVSTVSTSSDIRYHDDFQRFAYLPDIGRLITQPAWYGKFRLWDTDVSKLIYECCDGSSSTYGQLAPDGEQVAVYSSQSKSVRILLTEDGAGTGALSTRADVTELLYSDDGQWLATGEADGSVELWSVMNARQPVTAGFVREQPVRALAFDPGGTRIAAGSYGGYAHVWDMQGRLLFTLRHPVPVYDSERPDCSVVGDEPTTCDYYHVDHIAFARNGERILTLAWDGPDEGFAHYDARLWDAATGELIASFPGNTDEYGVIIVAGFAGQGDLAYLAASDGIVYVWNTETGNIEYSLGGHSAPVHTVDVDHLGDRLVSLTEEDDPRVWSLAPPYESSEYDSRKAATMVLGYSDLPSPAPVRAGPPPWEVELREMAYASARFPERRFTHCRMYDQAVSPDRNFVLTTFTACETEDYTAPQLLRVADGRLTYLRDKGWGHAVFSPDSRRLAVWELTSTIQLWNTETTELLIEFDTGGLEIADVAFREKGARLIAAAATGQVFAWELPPTGHALVDQAWAYVPQALDEIKR